jgi:hypothetical protein
LAHGGRVFEVEPDEIRTRLRQRGAIVDYAF